MSISPPKSATTIITRLNALINALREGPLSYPDLVERLATAYPSQQSMRRMILRDIQHLATLGIVITRSKHSPITYTLQGGTPIYSGEDLLALGVLRDTIGTNHPYTEAVERLLTRLTAGLSSEQREIYQSQRSSSVPLQPAINYTPYAQLIADLERAIASRRLLKLCYRTSAGKERIHTRIEPYAIEYYDRHFYLVAYIPKSGQMQDLRIDRIKNLEYLHTRPPGIQRTRKPVIFRYRLAANLAQGELSQRFTAQRVIERSANGDVIIEAEGRSDFFIIQTLLRYRANAELLSPPELRQRMIEEVRGLAELYGEG
ncbi:transcriptional regulator-like protein [Oscillochloris trichoides DG-6]|uniref:Transcriptional regulator-like protein n=1 Tax=Oscillochloris trichoides DG-6 TaxID=765420 RepID=E1IAC8_9CHLR|nr:WYL domain-containing protein [Oscillochloris trichoides]EFO81882.1 transcriptional regulator-like protein [Oscillochloris trichoides DG-6]